jgi:hypothetical protein
MDLSNPYKPPEAVLGATSIGSELELAGAVAPFVASYRPLRILALLCGLGALVSGAGMLTGNAMPQGQVVGMIAVIAGGYGMASILLFRLASGMRTLAKEPTLTKVAAVLNRMTQTWVVGLGALVLLFVGSWAQRFVAATAVTTTVWQTGPQESLVVSAGKLRRVLVIVVVVAAGIMLLGIVGVFVTAPATPGVSPSMLRSITIASALVQLAMLWLVWRQVPALDDFIARPDAASLRRVAAAHALIWRVIVGGIGLAFLLGIVAAVALPIVFRP